MSDDDAVPATRFVCECGGDRFTVRFTVVTMVHQPGVPCTWECDSCKRTYRGYAPSGVQDWKVR